MLSRETQIYVKREIGRALAELKKGTGAQGDPGEPGATGAAGANGVNGSPGAAGAAGSAGADGAAGADGELTEEAAGELNACLQVLLESEEIEMEEDRREELEELLAETESETE